MLLPLFLAGLPWGADAAVWAHDDHYHLASGDVLNDDLYAFPGDVEIDGDVRGDVTAAGSRIIIHGHVEGSVTVVARSLVVDGRVDGSVRAIAWEDTIRGTIARDVILLGNELILGSQAKIGRDLSVRSRTAILDGIVGRNVTVWADSVLVNALVRGDLTIRSGDVQSGSAAKTLGNASVSDSRKGAQHRSWVGSILLAVLLLTLVLVAFRLAFGGVLKAARFILQIAETARIRPEGSLAMGSALLIGTLLLIIFRVVSTGVDFLFLGLLAGFFGALVWLERLLFGPRSVRSIPTGLAVVLAIATALTLRIPLLIFGTAMLLGCLGLGALVLNLVWAASGLAQKMSRRGARAGSQSSLAMATAAADAEKGSVP